MLSELVGALQSIYPDLTAKDIADAIWLACHTGNMGTSRTVTPPDSNVVISETIGSSSLPATTGSPLEPTNPEKPLQTSIPPQAAASNLYLDAHEESGEGNQQWGALPFRTPAVVALSDALNIARALRPFMRRVPLLTK